MSSNVPVKRRQQPCRLSREQKEWINQQLKEIPSKWRFWELKDAFALKFPLFKIINLNQAHINSQRQKIRKEKTIALQQVDKVNTGSDDDETMDNQPAMDVGNQKKNSKTPVDVVQHKIYIAINSLGEQGMYLVDLIDEQGEKDDVRGSSSEDNDDEEEEEPMQPLDEKTLKKTIDSKTNELVELLVTQRRHEERKTRKERKEVNQSLNHISSNVDSGKYL